MDFDKLKAFLNDTDKFSQHNGIEVTALSGGVCEAMLTAGDNTSANGYISTAALIALAEKAAVAAAYTCGYVCRCINTTVNLTGAFKNSGIFNAKAVKVHHGRRTAVYDCEVFNGSDLVLKAGFTIIVTEEEVNAV